MSFVQLKARLSIRQPCSGSSGFERSSTSIPLPSHGEKQGEEKSSRQRLLIAYVLPPQPLTPKSLKHPLPFFGISPQSVAACVRQGDGGRPLLPPCAQPARRAPRTASAP